MGNDPNTIRLVKGYISPIRQGRRKGPMSSQTPLITPHHNDVLMGRGGKNNQHVGNDQLRTMAREECHQYRVSTKKGKSYISRELVRRVREMDPPGRFLKKSDEEGIWEDVGDDVAREKVSQVLRDAVTAEMANASSASAPEATTTYRHGKASLQHEIPPEEEFRRSSSAPTIMRESPAGIDVTTSSTIWEPSARMPSAEYRHHSWQGQHQQTIGTPHFPPVTPASATSAKRRRYVRNAAWTPYHADERPQQHSHTTPHYPPFDHYSPYHETPVAIPAPEYIPSSRSYSLQQQQQPARSHHPDQEQNHAILGDVDEHSGEFDLFDGELLESNNNDRDSLERRE